jgi:hypothetical protein
VPAEAAIAIVRTAVTGDAAVIVKLPPTFETPGTVGTGTLWFVPDNVVGAPPIEANVGGALLDITPAVPSGAVLTEPPPQPATTKPPEIMIATIAGRNAREKWTPAARAIATATRVRLPVPDVRIERITVHLCER